MTRWLLARCTRAKTDQGLTGAPLQVAKGIVSFVEFCRNHTEFGDAPSEVTMRIRLTSIVRKFGKNADIKEFVEDLVGRMMDMMEDGLLSDDHLDEISS